MVLKRIQRLWRRRKAISPVIATILLIAITVMAFTVVVSMVLPVLRGSGELEILTVKFEDTNGNRFADRINMKIANIGTAKVIISQVNIWCNEVPASWFFLLGSEIRIDAGSKSTVLFRAGSVEEEFGYGDKVTIELIFGGKSITLDYRISAKFSHFVLLYEEDFESGQQPSGWEHTLLYNHTRDAFTFSNLSQWIIEDDNGNHIWRCTNNDCQFIVLADPRRDFYDVNISYDLMTADDQEPYDDGNGIIFRYDNTSTYPKFYIVWYTRDHPSADHPPSDYAGEEQYFNWYEASDEMLRNKITIHYVEGTATGFTWYKIAETDWNRVWDQWYTWRLIADGDHIELYIDEVLTLSFTDSRISHGYIGLVSFANEMSCYDNIYVWHTES